jgi:hypothetical protein
MLVSLVVLEVDDGSDVLLLVLYGGPPSLEMILCHRPLHCHNSHRIGLLIGMAMPERTTHIRVSNSSVLALVKMSRLGAASILK